MLGLSRHTTVFRSMTSVMAVATMAVTAPAFAQQVRNFDIPAQAANKGVPQFAKQAGIQILANGNTLRGKQTNAVRGAMPVDRALRTLLSGTGLMLRDGVNGSGIKTIVEAPRQNSLAPAPVMMEQVAQESRAPAYDEIIVTAQKKEERITDVPIAMSAFSAEALDDYKIEGGSELLRAIPNVNFSKSNFSMYNFSIRGVGTKAISASSDPAVAVSFNNTPLVRNRLFEAEFFDIQRVEVLRGPQGTLYGRNATGGVVNIISALPSEEFGGELKGEVGNYKSRRLSGMMNVPLTETFGIRAAGAMTKRDGFDFNSFTQNRVNGRDLWSTRITAAWEPSDRFKANLIWQHFEEDDNRSRTGKQLCTRDEGPETLGGVTLTDPLIRAKFSQGCAASSLFDDAAFGAPAGYSLAYIFAAQSIVLGTAPGTFDTVYALKPIDPFGSVEQSRNLREIATSYDPVFRAKNDVLQLNVEAAPFNGVKIISQTAYSKDNYYSSQDYNRFVSDPIFNDSNGLLDSFGRPISDNLPRPTRGGMFCDPQLGCSDRLLSIDISKSKNRQWSQEFRMQSDFQGKFDFNIGVNYINFKTDDKYYVLNNMFTLIAQYYYGASAPGMGLGVPRNCPLGYEELECIYVDPNPLGSMNDNGHNYFLSKNMVEIESKAVFGELYYRPTDNLKLTIGARYTDDFKDSSQIPSQLLLGGGAESLFPGQSTGGRVNSGYPALPNIRQSWKKFTGRLVMDWKPDLSFSDESLIYASVSRGYKGGGTNPPRVDLNPDIVQYLPLETTFRPEFVNAFEIGIKNTFNGGRLNLNATAFMYDYKDYQVSQIVDRIAFNENFDAKSWGVEFEAAWRPTDRFRVDASLGYLRTRIGRGAESIDVMNRTQGNEDWVLLRPWLQAPSNCIAPRVLVEKILQTGIGFEYLALGALCPGGNRLGDFNPATSGGIPFEFLFPFTYDPLRPYNPDTIGLNIANGGSGAPNGGRGFSADLSGNELPNSPRITFNVGANYSIPIADGRWSIVMRGDYYRQSKSYSRIYNSVYDKIRGWDNVNLSVQLNSRDKDLSMQLYVKNVFNNDSITDAFTNADDTGLSANVFTVDPRIIGFSVSKKF